jgi:hypothetical protein
MPGTCWFAGNTSFDQDANRWATDYTAATIGSLPRRDAYLGALGAARLLASSSGSAYATLEGWMANVPLGWGRGPRRR